MEEWSQNLVESSSTQRKTKNCTLVLSYIESPRKTSLTRLRVLTQYSVSPVQKIGLGFVLFGLHGKLLRDLGIGTWTRA